MNYGKDSRLRQKQSTPQTKQKKKSNIYYGRLYMNINSWRKGNNSSVKCILNSDKASWLVSDLIDIQYNGEETFYFTFYTCKCLLV